MATPSEWIITDFNYKDFINPVINGHQFANGCFDRDYSQHPSGYCAAVPSAPPSFLIPKEEWTERLADQQAYKASLYDLRESNYDVLQSLNQDGLGLCWNFSTTKAVMYLRAIMGQPGTRLSGWYIAGLINNWRDQGGWGVASCAKAAEVGIPSEEICPKYSRTYDTPEVAADAAKRKVTLWYDGNRDTNINKQIMISAYLLGLPPVCDYNFLSHSMCGCRLVSLDPLTVDLDNSWGPDSGNKGLYRITGDKAIPDAIVIPQIVMADGYPSIDFSSDMED